MFATRHLLDLLPATDRSKILSAAVLEVGLFGRFHEYERGIIAAAQVFEPVTLSPWCSRCLVKGTLEEAVALVGRPLAGNRVLVPTCATHLEDAATVLGLAELSQALGVSVAWADDGDPISNVAFRDLQTLRPTPLRTLPGVDDLLPGEVAHIFAEADGGGRQPRRRRGHSGAQRHRA
jgi:hypothetical protein